MAAYQPEYIQQQADWNQSDQGAPSFIQNKPGNASNQSAGLLSVADKAKLDSIKVSQNIRMQTDAGGNFSWTFPNAFGPGVVPRVSVTVEVAGLTLLHGALITTPTNTGVSGRAFADWYNQPPFNPAWIGAIWHPSMGSS